MVKKKKRVEKCPVCSNPRHYKLKKHPQSSLCEIETCKMRIYSALHCQPNGKLVVCVGGLDYWDPRMKGIVMKGVPPFESRPQTTSLPLVDMDSQK